MCNRMEEHLNKAAVEVSNHQAVLTAKVKEVTVNTAGSYALLSADMCQLEMSLQ